MTKLWDVLTSCVRLAAKHPDSKSCDFTSFISFVCTFDYVMLLIYLLCIVICVLSYIYLCFNNALSYYCLVT